MDFGKYIRQKRIDQGLTLREFCQQYNRDPGNWSKIERGLMPPPQSYNKLKKIAFQLGIQEGSDEWHDFIDSASVAAGIVPQDILNDRELVAKLPVFFRTLRNIKPQKKELKPLATILRENH